MSISTRLEAINQHLLDDYDVLELAGADLTNVDKNILNLKQSWEERLLYFLANGTDVVWNNWLPKVNGTGENITLNNTIQAKMDFVYKGNTSQESTTGKNLLNVNKTPENIWENTQYEIALNETKVKNNKIAVYSYIEFYIDDLKPNTTYTISFDATISNSIVSIDIMKQRNTTTTQNRLLKMDGTTSGHYSNQFTTESDTSAMAINLYGLRGTYQENAVTTYTNVQIEEGTTATSYEPYTGGNPAPNPDYPYPVNVVTGDNEVKVEGKNLFNKDKSIDYSSSATATPISTGVRVTSSSTGTSHFVVWLLGKASELNGKTVRLSSNIVRSTDVGAIRLISCDENVGNRNIIVQSFGEGVKTISNTINLAENLYVGVQLLSNQSTTTSGVYTDYTDVVVTIDNEDMTYTPYTSQTYPINLGSMELCKIGDYQDYIAKSTGKNLFDKDSGFRLGYINSSGTFVSENLTALFEQYIEVSDNKEYTISFKQQIRSFNVNYYDNNKTFISRSSTISNKQSATFTTPNNVKYIVIQFSYASNTTMTQEIIDSLEPMFNEGTTALPYEPYGKVWYKYGAIGKEEINTSDFRNIDDSNTNINFAYINKPTNDIKRGGVNRTIPILSTKQKYSERPNGYNDANLINCILDGGTVQYYMGVSKEIDTLQKAKNYIGNFTIYYVLATPTITEITDELLTYQLEQIKYSYSSQTNISQTNTDKPFILDVVALGEI